jgi:hypothetical protein
VPAIVNSSVGTNWVEASVLYSNYVDVTTGLTNFWKDQNGTSVTNLRVVFQRNDWMTGGMVRNASGRAWSNANTYSTWRLDPAVVLDFLTGQAPEKVRRA